MYRWRCLTPDQRERLLDERRRDGVPWHSPPHYEGDTSLYMITAACYEHRHVIGHSPRRMVDFEMELVETIKPLCRQVFAWTVLPNHYHLLLDLSEVKPLLMTLGRLHGRTAFRWNGEDGCRGRKTWCNAAETAMKSERHFWASLNYVLNNAVHHGYVEQWQDWPYSNARQYVADVGREAAERVWREYPILDYGKHWDPSGL